MDVSDRVFQAQLADYSSARDELVGAISNQHLALTFGTASLAAVFVAGFVSWEASIAPAIFFAIVPLSWWILVMWLGEVVRMLRAVEFCGAQEQVIDEAIGQADPEQASGLRWERWRREPGKPERTITWTYASVAVLLLCTNAAAMTCATVTSIRADWPAWLLALVWMFTLAVGMIFVRWVLRVFQGWVRRDVGMRPTSFTRIFERLPLGDRTKPSA
jgi:hypothetical protein